jgi:hypothetical protein
MIIFSTEKKYRDRNPQRFAVGFLFCFANWVLCKPPTPRRGRGRESRGRAPCLQYSPVQNSVSGKGDPDLAMGPVVILPVSGLRLWGKQTWPISRRYLDGTQQQHVERAAR